MKVRVIRGMTINLGNYESAKFEVGVEIDAEDYQSGYQEALNQVLELCDQEVEAIKTLKGSRKV